MIRKTFLSAAAVLVLASAANAGPVYLHLVLNPATTAGAGISTVGQNGHTISSTAANSGANRWHLYALDDNTSSLGIASYSINLNGVVGAIGHRSPTGTGNYIDPETEEPASGSIGFNLLRSATQGVISNIQAAQNLPDQTPFKVEGFGRSASNLTAQANTDIAGATATQTAGTSGMWGNYATDPALPAGVVGKSWLQIAEGQFTAGNQPTFAGLSETMYVRIYDPNGGCATAPYCTVSSALDFQISGGTSADVIPSVNDLNLVVANASIPGSTSGTVTQTGGTAPITWGGFTFASYTPGFGAPNTPAQVAEGTAEAGNANFATGTQLFSWNTLGAPRGTYVWNVSATNAAGTDGGLITVQVQGVPEPATFALVGLAVVGLAGIRRRS